jgi:hypothetical protein
MVIEVQTIGELVGAMGGARTGREQGVQVVRRGGVAVGWRGKGAIGLIEDDVLRDQLGVRGEIEAPVALMLRIVAKEDTTTGEEGGGGAYGQQWQKG